MLKVDISIISSVELYSDVLRVREFVGGGGGDYSICTRLIQLEFKSENSFLFSSSWVYKRGTHEIVNLLLSWITSSCHEG